MLTLFTTATAVLALVVIYQERKYRYFQGLTLTIFKEVCRKWRPTAPFFDAEHREKAKIQNKNC